jgi:HK97 family phage major capsid protein
MSEPKSWSPQELLDHVKSICGSVVTEKLEPLQKRVTDYGSWIDGQKSNPMGRNVNLASVNEMKGILFGSIITALAVGKGDHERAIGQLKRDEKNKDMNLAVIKALEQSTATAGGVLVNEQISSDFIDLLTPRAVVRSFGTTVLPMDSGSMSVPKMTAASTAYYIGENTDAVKSQQTFGMKRLTAKKLAVLVPISNDLLRRGGPRVSAIVRNDALRSAGLKEDVSFIRSQGGAYSPIGLRYQAAAANILTQTGAGTYDLDSVTGDLGTMILALEEANVAFSNPGWIMAPRTRQFLMTLRDGLGNFAFRAEMLTGKLWGWPFKVTTQVPRNLGSGANESELYLADFDDVIIGDTMNLEVAISDQASYKDENGTLVSAFSLDQTVMRVLLEHDIVLRHDESVAVLTGVRWTPGGAS